MTSREEIEALQQQLDQINQDLLEYSEEEHHQVEIYRNTLRHLVSTYGAQAELAIVAVCLEISIQRALNEQSTNTH